VERDRAVNRRALQFAESQSALVLRKPSNGKPGSAWASLSHETLPPGTAFLTNSQTAALIGLQLVRQKWTIRTVSAQTERADY
jgi:hypothetical protein